MLWLTKNAIQKAFEIESTTSIYSGLLRLNDLGVSQPNIRIDLYVAAQQAKRSRVFSQLVRPSFQQLMPRCRVLAFESIEQPMARLAQLPLEAGARVSGLIQGEVFAMPEHLVYPPERS